GSSRQRLRVPEAAARKGHRLHTTGGIRPDRRRLPVHDREQENRSGRENHGRPPAGQSCPLVDPLRPIAGAVHRHEDRTGPGVYLAVHLHPLPDRRQREMRSVFLAAILLAMGGSIAFGQWHRQTIDTKADFRGLCVVSADVVWVGGTKGTFGRTTDGGKTWSVGTVPGAEKLDFRDVEAFGKTTAYLLSAGPGDASRIYKSTDGGKSWELQFKSDDPAAFFDAIAFWDEQNGIALGDPVKGVFQLIITADGGRNWKPLATKNLPAALPGEGAFAASGTCLVTHGDKDVWFATGGAKTTRVFR